MEKDPDGTVFLRVQEEAYNPLTSPQRTIIDKQIGPAPGNNTVLDGDQTWRVQNVDEVDTKHGLTLQGSNTVSIYDYTYFGHAGGGSIYGAGHQAGRQ